jgi:hypothetical protein
MSYGSQLSRFVVRRNCQSDTLAPKFHAFGVLHDSITRLRRPPSKQDYSSPSSEAQTFAEGLASGIVETATSLGFTVHLLAVNAASSISGAGMVTSKCRVLLAVEREDGKMVGITAGPSALTFSTGNGGTTRLNYSSTTFTSELNASLSALTDSAFV